MRRRLIGLFFATLFVAGCGGGGTHSMPPVSVTNAGAGDAKKAPVAFSIAVPTRKQSAHNRHLEYVSTATKSASFAVAAGNAVPAPADTVTVTCTTVCSGTILAPIGSDTFVAKLFDAAAGAGNLLSTGTAKQTIVAGTNTVKLTFNPVVASVALSLNPSALAANAAPPHNTAQLDVIAKDASTATIVGPGSYVGANGQPLTITIASSPLPNTTISPTPTQFTAPQNSAGISNVATITFTPPGHFQFPTFTVVNPALPSVPQGGVTLLYEPIIDDNFYWDGNNPFDKCVAIAPPSVGGAFFPHPSGCPTADLVQVVNTAITQTFSVNPSHNGVSLGWSSDKQVYFAYTPAASPTPTTTVFGKLNEQTPSSSPTSEPVPFTIITTSASLGPHDNMTLGNDGNLWFRGTATDGSGIIGNVPPGPVPAPKWYTIPNSKPPVPAGSQSVLSFGPGLGNTEILLYTHFTGSVSTVHLARISAAVAGFTDDVLVTSMQPSPFGASPSVGDLLTAADGSVYVSVDQSVYHIDTGGNLSLWTGCAQVSSGVFRLPDGTGIGLTDGFTAPPSFLHVVPGLGCTPVPPWGGTQGFLSLDSVDVTTDNWQFFSQTMGHRRGVF